MQDDGEEEHERLGEHGEKFQPLLVGLFLSSVKICCRLGVYRMSAQCCCQDAVLGN